MQEDDYSEPDYRISYYLLDDGAVARIWYNVDANEYFDGEILDERGRWKECPVEEIMADGVEIDFPEAQEHVAALGGTI